MKDIVTPKNRTSIYRAYTITLEYEITRTEKGLDTEIHQDINTSLDIIKHQPYPLGDRMVS